VILAHFGVDAKAGGLGAAGANADCQVPNVKAGVLGFHSALGNRHSAFLLYHIPSTSGVPMSDNS
jgi:hypothetical protein